MAEEEAAMTPEQAAAAIAGVRDYRQGLTSRAAGIVWMVWAVALSGYAVMELGAAEDLLDGPAGGGTVLAGNTIWETLLPLVFLGGAIVISNAVWKAHAIERDETHKAWVAWAVAIGITVAFVIALLIVVYVGLWLWLQDPSNVETVQTTGETVFVNEYVFVSPVYTAGFALALTLLMRSRVRMLPGFLAVGALLLLQILVPVVTSGSLVEKVDQAATLHAWTTFIALLSVGLWHFKRG